MHQLNDFGNHQFLVIAFLGTECPLAKQYAVRLMDLEKKFGPKGIGFIGVDPNVQDSLSEMEEWIKEIGLTFPLLKDNEAKLADTLGATRTPEIFVVDHDGIVRFRGAGRSVRFWPDDRVFQAQGCSSRT